MILNELQNLKPNKLQLKKKTTTKKPTTTKQDQGYNFSVNQCLSMK